MYCKKCGQQINEGAAFCGNCGTPVVTKNPNAGTSMNTAFQSFEAEQGKKKKGGKKVLGILLLCLVILLGKGAGGWFFLYKPIDGKSKETVNEEELPDETEEIVEKDDKEEIHEADEQEVDEHEVEEIQQEAEDAENEERETDDTEPVYHENDEYGIHTYELIVDDVTWTEAYNACLARGGYLVRINSDEEYQSILEQIAFEEKNNIKFWLGGARSADEYEYRWIYEDGTAGSTVLNEDELFRYYWLDGEPSFHDESVSQDEMYMNMFYVSKEGRWIWNDVPNDLLAVVEYYSGTVGYICEYED